MKWCFQRSFQALHVCFWLLLASSGAAAQEDRAGSFEALKAFESQSNKAIVVEAAALIHDLRDWKRAWEYRRTQLKEFKAGDVFFKKAASTVPSFLLQRELEALLMIAAPDLSAVPAAVIIFSEANGLPQFQALMKVGQGWRERFDSSGKQALWANLGVSFEKNEMRIVRPDFNAWGIVDSDGWLRISFSQYSLAGGRHEGALFNPKLNDQLHGVAGTVFIRNGPLFKRLVMPFVINPQLAGLLDGFNGLALTWEIAQEATSRFKLLFDIMGLGSMGPLLKADLAKDKLARLWSQEASGFLTFSMPPLLMNFLRQMAFGQLGSKQRSGPELGRDFLLGMDGQIGFVNYDSPQDWALGVAVGSEVTASGILEGLWKSLEQRLRTKGVEPTSLLELSTDGSKENQTLVIRPTPGSEGIRIANIGSALFVVPQRARLKKLRQFHDSLKSEADVKLSILNGPLEPTVREVLEEPAMISGYTVLGSSGLLIELGKWFLGDMNFFADDIGKLISIGENNSLVKPLAKFSSHLDILELVYLLSYDVGLMVNVDESLFMAQIAFSDM